MKRIYKLMLAVILLLPATALMAQSYFTDYGNYGRTDAARKLNSLTFKRNSVTSLVLAVNQGTVNGVSPIYFDKTTEIINVSPGDVLTINYNWTGAWMHNIVYVDWNNDNRFTDDGSDNERIGYNGENAGSEMTKPITYTIPVSQTLGQYRMRIMVDWLDANSQSIPNSHDRNGINNNGGSVVDVVLNVAGAKIVELKTLIGKYKAYTATQYPVVGTYAEPAWNAFQSAITTAEAYVADEQNITDNGITAQTDALNAAAATLETRAALPKLLSAAKAMNKTQYPIGIIMGFYPQAKWDALEAAIATVSTFVVNTTVTDTDIATNQTMLQTAIDELTGSMILPFKVSDENKEHWYQIRDMRNPNNYWEIGAYSWTSEDGLKSENYPAALIMNQVGDNASDYQLFKITRAPSPSKGYYIYSKLDENAPLSANVIVNKVQLNGDSIPATWQIGRTVDASHFTIYLEGKVTKQLNSFANYTPPHIAFYYPGDGKNDFGNNWEFVELVQVGQTDFTALKTLVGKAISMLQADYPTAHYSAEKWTAFANARTVAINIVAKENDNPQPTQAEVDAALATLETTISELNASYVPFVESTDAAGPYYFIHDKRSPKGWMRIGLHRVVVAEGDTTVHNARLLYTKKAPTADSLSYQFRVVKIEEGVYNLYSRLYPETPLSVSSSAENVTHVDPVTVAGEETKWTFGATPAADATYRTITTVTTAQQLNSYQTPGYVGFWDPQGTDDPGNDWMFESVPVSSAVKQVTVSDLGIFVVNRRIVAKDASAKLNVYNMLGQRVNAKADLARGIYLVQVQGKQGAVKVFVR